MPQAPEATGSMKMWNCVGFIHACAHCAWHAWVLTACWVAGWISVRKECVKATNIKRAELESSSFPSLLAE